MPASKRPSDGRKIHRRMGPGLEVARCRRRDDDGRPLKFAQSRRQITCEDCLSIIEDESAGHSRVAESMRARRRFLASRWLR